MTKVQTDFFKIQKEQSENREKLALILLYLSRSGRQNRLQSIRPFRNGYQRSRSGSRSR